MIQYFVSLFTQIAQKKHSQKNRIAYVIMTTVLIFIVMPLFYVYTGHHIASFLSLPIATTIINSIAALSLCMGAIVIIWTLLLQYHYGKGSGSHMVPTQILISSGPYKVSRHPMLVGAIFFYFGIGTLVSSLFIGFYSAFITAILACFFVRYIEEPVLIARFGEQYKTYQKTVPIIPFSPSCFNHSNRKHKSDN